MELKRSLKERRLGVVVTLLSLITVVSIFEYGTSLQWNLSLKIAGLISLITFIIGLIFIYIKTGLWKFTHKPIENLDEREIALTSKSLRYAYSTFSVIVLALLLSFSVLDKPVNIVLVVSLIVFAHLLPASVIAWTEKQIESDNNELT